MLKYLVTALLMSFSSAVASQACEIKAKDELMEHADVGEFGQLRVKFLSTDADGTVFIVDIKAPNFEKRAVRLRENVPLVLQICGQEVTLNAKEARWGNSLSSNVKGISLKVSIF